MQAHAEQSAPGAGEGSSSAEDLAKKLANPGASLISVPLQNNFDESPGEVMRFTISGDSLAL
jgi:hypothetical protein